MSKEKFAFDKTNFILLGIGMAVVIIGFLLIIFQTQITQMTRISNIPICVICVIHV